MEIDDADEAPAEDPEAEAGGAKSKADDENHGQNDPVGDLKSFLEGIFFNVHFLPV